MRSQSILFHLNNCWGSVLCFKPIDELALDWYATFHYGAQCTSQHSNSTRWDSSNALSYSGNTRSPQWFYGSQKWNCMHWEAHSKGSRAPTRDQILSSRNVVVWYEDNLQKVPNVWVIVDFLTHRTQQLDNAFCHFIACVYIRTQSAFDIHTPLCAGEEAVYQHIGHQDIEPLALLNDDCNCVINSIQSKVAYRLMYGIIHCAMVQREWRAVPSQIYASPHLNILPPNTSEMNSKWKQRLWWTNQGKMHHFNIKKPHCFQHVPFMRQAV